MRGERGGLKSRKTEVWMYKEENIQYRIMNNECRIRMNIDRENRSIAVGFSQRMKSNNSSGLQPHILKMWLKPVS